MLSIPPTAPRRARHLLPAGRASFVAGERPIVAFRESETGRLFEVPQRSGVFALGRARDSALWLPRVGVAWKEWELGRIPRGVPVVEVPHLRDRRMEIPRLFAEAMARREWPTQLADLGAENARTMMEREWPGNGDDIENVAAQIAHLLQSPHDQARRRELAAIGLTFPARTAERRERRGRPSATKGTR